VSAHNLMTFYVTYTKYPYKRNALDSHASPSFSLHFPQQSIHT